MGGDGGARARAQGRHDGRLEKYNPFTGAFAPVEGEWVLVQNTLKTDKLSPDYDGPFVVVDVEKGADGVPTGWVGCAEVLGGIQPGAVGYPARGKRVVVVTDRLWPFNHSRVTADEVMMRKLPDGWAVVSAVLAGPREDGRFEVKWAHMDETAWVYAAEIAGTIPFKEYCKAKQIDVKTLDEDQRKAAVSTKAGVPTGGGAQEGAPSGGAAPRRAARLGK